ncbi:MAG: TPM domain-containing protein [Candidatus Omnitrophica bacterium]|jgi:uncharacterized protein|nr:TPM domain-containing protein [Candidatus Omnitrophota bacterium]
MIKKYIVCFFALISPILIWAQEIPEPQGWINDFAGVLKSDYKEKIYQTLVELEQKTSTEIAVVTIDSIAPLDEKAYARKLFDQWKPGKKGKDNGVLVLLVVKDRLWRIETGYGIEGLLTDAKCGVIGREYMVPYFKNNKYEQGLYYGAKAIAQTIYDKQGIKTGSSFKLKSPNEQNIPFLLYPFLFFFFLLWNIPWPIFIGLPFTLIFAAALSQQSDIAGGLIIAGYIGATLIRYHIWLKMPAKNKRKFIWFIIFGLMASGNKSAPGKGGSEGWHGGGYSGGGGGGSFGGGGGGGGGAGGKF